MAKVITDSGTLVIRKWGDQKQELTLEEAKKEAEKRNKSAEEMGLKTRYKATE